MIPSVFEVMIQQFSQQFCVICLNFYEIFLIQNCFDMYPSKINLFDLFVTFLGSFEQTFNPLMTSDHKQKYKSYPSGFLVSVLYMSPDNN